MTEIERLNPNIRDMLAHARRPINRKAGAWQTELPILTLLHLTDAHSAVEDLKRITAFMSDMQGLYEDAVCSGDMIFKYFHTGYSFWHECGCDPIMTCIGNHDALNNSLYNWADVVPQKQLASTIFEPFTPGWNVEYTPGTTYYCKRYSEHKIDLITLNTMLPAEEDVAQNTFLKDKLDRALRENTAVVMLVHNTSNREQVVVPSLFSCLDRVPTDPCGDGLRRHHQQAVQDFMDAGGDFICYLAGHCHQDYICYDPDFPKQVFFLGPTASRLKGVRQSDGARVENEKSHDAFNFVSFDRATKTIKIIRVGADRDHYLRHRGTLCFDYANTRILFED